MLTKTNACWSVLIILAIGLASCGPSYFYEESYEMSGDAWVATDSLNFTFSVSDTQQIYNLYLDIVHSPDYDYQNLYVRIHTHFPNGRRLSEPLSLELADRFGRWHGECSDEECLLSIPIQEGAFFSQPGTYTITAEQFMRQDTLPGIHRIGFKVEETDSRR